MDYGVGEEERHFPNHPGGMRTFSLVFQSRRLRSRRLSRLRDTRQQLERCMPYPAA